MGKQNLEEWKMYKSTVINVLFKKGFKVIDISGNHDQWAVGEVNSKEFDFSVVFFLLYLWYNTSNERKLFMPSFYFMRRFFSVIHLKGGFHS